MLRKLIIITALVCSAGILRAQDADTLGNDAASHGFDESSFTFTEAQLDEDDNDSRSATVLGSANNIFFSNASMTFSPSNYRFRALENKYNEVYINGAMLNDPERGNFRFTQIGGLNNISRNSDYALPFEGNNYCFSGVAGSVNYDFRPSQVPQGHKLSASLANRTYTGRLMYTYATGIQDDGWAFAVNFTGRYAAIDGFKNVEGAFYNSLSYYFGTEYYFNTDNSISICTFANPTERGSRGASTDEVYYLAGSNSYNPYLGWYDGEIRNSRVVRDFAPTSLVTWTYSPSDKFKLSTTAFLVISNYSTTKLQYGDGGSNPSPDYYNRVPSYFYDVYNVTDDPTKRDDAALANWNAAYDSWTSSVNYRYIDFDKLYFLNRSLSAEGLDAAYYQTQVHTDRVSAGLASNARISLGTDAALHFGISFSRNKSNHYQTMYDLLGAKYFHNINTYATRTYDRDAIEVQYDYRYPNKSVGVGDVFGYDYNIFVDKLSSWCSYTMDKGGLHFYATGKIGYTDMFREGKMQNGLAPNNSYGPSAKSYFTDGGVKGGVTYNIGSGHAVEGGIGWQSEAPKAGTAFASPEINNDFVANLRCENIISAQLSYAYTTARIKANLSGYYNKMSDVTRWTCFYYDNVNAFTYFSMTGIEKVYYGAELGLRVNVMPSLDVLMLGTISDAKYVGDADALCMNSNNAAYTTDIVKCDGMREDGTPLSIISLGLEYNIKGWYIDLTGNYYDRIYLSFSPMTRTLTSLTTEGNTTLDRIGQMEPPAQTKGEGGFMLDGSIGKNIRLKSGSLYCGLMLTNILNNTNICTGGYEQNRSDVKFTDGEANGMREYQFSKNPKKYYAWGINGMLNIVYRF
ncbi:MAG: TonB-dependent receptor [Bacteroidales bacterium]|nr:TonB-dependent receptor [Bacteroidales bacterium]